MFAYFVFSSRKKCPKKANETNNYVKRRNISDKDDMVSLKTLKLTLKKLSFQQKNNFILKLQQIKWASRSLPKNQFNVKHRKQNQFALANLKEIGCLKTIKNKPSTSTETTKCSTMATPTIQTLPNNVIRSNYKFNTNFRKICASKRIHLHRMINYNKQMADIEHMTTTINQPNHCQLMIINKRKLSMKLKRKCSSNEINAINNEQFILKKKHKAIRNERVKTRKQSMEFIEQIDNQICIDIRKMFCTFLLPLLILFSNLMPLAAAGKSKKNNFFPVSFK